MMVIVSIECYHDTLSNRRIAQHRWVSESSATRFLDCKNIVTQFSKFFHDLQTEVFVRVDSGHGRLRLLLAAEDFINLGAIRIIVTPRFIKILTRQTADILDDFVIASTQVTPLHQTMH